MWANKHLRRGLALICALTLFCPAALAAPQFATKEAAPGTLSRQTTFEGDVQYLTTENVTLNLEGAIFVEFLAEPGQTLQPGDPILTYTLTMDENQLLRRKIALEDAQDDHAYELSQRQKRIDEYRAAAHSAPTQAQRRQNELLAEKEELLLSRYIPGAEAEIARLQAEYDQAAQANEPKQLCCAAGGVLHSLIQISPGDAIPAGKALAHLYDPATLLVRVANPNGELKYGMTVNLLFSDRSAKATSAGLVVSAANVLPAAQQSGYAYIRPTEDLSALGYPSVSATAETLRLENVLLVSDQCLEFVNAGYRVRFLDAEGGVHMRYVNRALAAGQNVWVIQGVEPGDKLITK